MGRILLTDSSFFNAGGYCFRDANGNADVFFEDEFTPHENLRWSNFLVYVDILVFGEVMDKQLTSLDRNRLQYAFTVGGFATVEGGENLVRVTWRTHGISCSVQG